MDEQEHSQYLEAIEQRLGYRFRNRRLLLESLTHSTFVHEQQQASSDDNQRLEFLGDAVLGLTTGHLLMDQFPDIREGELTRMRANLVNETQLAAIARSLSLGRYIRLGKGEIQTQGRDKNSILADTFEALIAAVYIDGGFDNAQKIVNALFTKVLQTEHIDAKTRLQERVQKTGQAPPVYQVIDEAGPDHDKTFTVELHVSELTARARGKSKKLAEKAAAQKALTALDNK